jgi:hypothetical protein
MGSLRFTATLVARGPAAAIVLDEQQVAAIGEGAKRFPVRASVNGYTWRTTITPRRGEHQLGLARAVRTEAGVEIGDVVEVEIERDSAPREVTVPPELADALAADAKAQAAFDALSYTHRKEFARWVQEAKREDTRRRRVERTLSMLREGRKPS